MQDFFNTVTTNLSTLLGGKKTDFGKVEGVHKNYNVILIVSDTLAAKHMSSYGYHRDTTPFLSKYFKEQGIVYENARSTASWTLPSFASFMRSRMPSDIFISELVEDETTIPAQLRKNNVRIKAILKNFDKPITILQTIGILFKENEYETHGYHDHEGTFKSALRWLKQEVATDKEDPFFLLVHDATVHNPYEETPQKYKHLFGQDEVDNGPETIWDYLQHLGPDNKVSAQEKERIIALYDQGVRYLDDLLQDFIQNIPKKIIDSSVIFFVADHGDEFGNHDGKFNHGQSLYEELIHVPFMVRVPHIKPCSIKSSVSLLDLAPTILSVFDIKPPKKYCGNILDSKREKNVTKLILAEGDVPPFKRHTDLFTIDKKYLDKKVFHPLHQLSVMRGDWKFIATTEKSELFNVTNDPMESKNLYTKNALFKKTDLNTIQKLVKYAKKRINTSESSSVFAEQQK